MYIFLLILAVIMFIIAVYFIQNVSAQGYSLEVRKLQYDVAIHNQKMGAYFIGYALALCIAAAYLR